jgi:PadR family transcriptional regulator, regulatory protein PadR
MTETPIDYVARTGIQMRKGTLEFCVLLVIARAEEVYAGDIITQLRQAEQLVVEGTVYPLLSRLKRDGLITHRWEESQTGPPRKYYTLTPAGLTALELLKQQWQALHKSITHLSKVTRHA